MARGVTADKQFFACTAGYMDDVYDFDTLAENFRSEVKDVEFDTLVGRGLSGAIVVPRLAALLGVKWLIVRKPGDSSHSCKRAEGYLGKRWLFVDDFILSGETYGEVVKAIRSICEQGAYDYKLGTKVEWETEHVGYWGYQHHEFYLADSEYLTVKRQVYGGEKRPEDEVKRPEPKPLVNYGDVDFSVAENPSDKVTIAPSIRFNGGGGMLDLAKQAWGVDRVPAGGNDLDA